MIYILSRKYIALQSVHSIKQRLYHIYVQFYLCLNVHASCWLGSSRSPPGWSGYWICNCILRKQLRKHSVPRNVTTLIIIGFDNVPLWHYISQIFFVTPLSFGLYMYMYACICISMCICAWLWICTYMYVYPAITCCIFYYNMAITPNMPHVVSSVELWVFY